MMAKATRISRTGDPKVMELVSIPEMAPGVGEAWVEHDSIGVNFLDVTQRNGAVPVPLPSGLGLEAAGQVTAVGSDVSEVAVGDRVAYVLGPIGSYATGRLYPAKRLLRLPATVSTTDAAAVLFKGTTAHYLLHSTFPVGPGTVVLAYGVAGGLGQILASWAKHLGATVIGVVSKPESVARGNAAGCDATLVWGGCDLAAEIVKATGGRKADVVYDGIGRDTFNASLDCLRPRGLMVSIGASSGVPEPVSVGTLSAKGSLFLTRPGLGAHLTDLDEYRSRAEAVLAALDIGAIAPNIWKTFALEDAPAAHEALETGKSTGTILLRP